MSIKNTFWREVCHSSVLWHALLTENILAVAQKKLWILRIIQELAIVAAFSLCSLSLGLDEALKRKEPWWGLVSVHFILGTREEVASTFRTLQSSLAQVVLQSMWFWGQILRWSYKIRFCTHHEHEVSGCARFLAACMYTDTCMQTCLCVSSSSQSRLLAAPKAYAPHNACRQKSYLRSHLFMGLGLYRQYF